MAKKKKDLPEVKSQKGDSSARIQAIKLAMDQIEKQYGKGSIMKLGGAGQKYKVDVVSPMCLSSSYSGCNDDCTCERVCDEDENEDVIKDESGIADKKDNEKSLEYLDNNLNSFKIEEFSLIDVDNEYKKFRDYLKANGKRYKDYMAAFRNWLRSDYVKKNKVVKYGLD